MKIGDKIRGMIRSFLRLEPSQEKSFTINEELDFNATIFMHRLWYRGKAYELGQFYRQMDNIDCPFWGASSTKGLEIRRIHTGLPRRMVDTLEYIVTHDLNDITLTETGKQELWNAISDENDLPQLYKKAIKSTLIAGDGAFKMSFDPEVSQYPIIEWYPGDRVEFKYNRGRMQEIIFLSKYDRYTLREHYGRGYVRYELFDGDKVVSLSNVKELAGLNEVKYDDGFIMAVPFMITESEQWEGRGASIFEGKTGNFDALDEAWSQWVHAMRASRPVKYIPEVLIPHDEENGTMLKPNPFDNQFVQIAGVMQEGVNNQIDLEQPAFNSSEYSATLNSALDFALQGIISPSTLGIDVKKMDNAEAQREKEKATLYTRNNVIGSFTEVLKALVDISLKSYCVAQKKPIEGAAAEIVFGEYANPSFEAVVEVMSNPNTPMSIEAKVDELWGDSKDDEWKELEIQRIKEQQGIATVEEPALNITDSINDGQTSPPSDDGAKTLNGAQTQSLIAIMGQYSGGGLSEGQAVKLISTAIGITTEDASKILKGEV